MSSISNPLYAYKNIVGAATTAVKSGAGQLGRIVINRPITSATITIYDNTAGSGTLIGTITLPGTLTNDCPITVDYGVAFLTGLTIVTTGANLNLTIAYL